MRHGDGGENIGAARSVGGPPGAVALKRRTGRETRSGPPFAYCQPVVLLAIGAGVCQPVVCWASGARVAVRWVV